MLTRCAGLDPRIPQAVIQGCTPTGACSSRSRWSCTPPGDIAPVRVQFNFPVEHIVMPMSAGRRTPQESLQPAPDCSLGCQRRVPFGKSL